MSTTSKFLIFFLFIFFLHGKKQRPNRPPHPLALHRKTIYFSSFSSKKSRASVVTHSAITTSLVTAYHYVQTALLNILIYVVIFDREKCSSCVCIYVQMVVQKLSRQIKVQIVKHYQLFCDICSFGSLLKFEIKCFGIEVCKTFC